ncbi:AAA family ATPase [Streptomyces sp. NPDC005065]|uniref:AAA family ATPase n=1 Tax=Streptomyces sp. NPDC005065 TaxID=3154461 RepID=UPI0033AEA41A
MTNDFEMMTDPEMNHFEADNSGTGAFEAKSRAKFRKGFPSVDMLTSISDHSDESENPTQNRLAAFRSALVRTGELDSLPDPVSLIEGVLFKDSLAWLYGKPGSGKSLVALDMAGCIAGGIPWNLREATRGTVLYLVAEGTAGMKRRVRAWEHATRVPMDGVEFLPVAVQLLNGVDLAALVLLVEELSPSLIVVDTQARCTIGANENDNGEMGKVVEAADRLREASGACVLMIHHSGRNGENLRGASAFDGAAASVLKVTQNDGYVEVHCEKQKDAQDFETVFLKMTPVLESVVLTNRMADPTTGSELSKNEKKVLETMRDSFPSSLASRKQIQEASDIAVSSLYKAVGRLETKGYLRQEGTEKMPRWVLTGTGRAAVPPEERFSPPNEN